MPRYIPGNVSQKAAQHSLKKAQDTLHPNDPETGQANASDKKKRNLRSYTQGGADIIFLLLISFGVLKDIYDITSAGLLSEGAISSDGGNIVIEVAKELAILVGSAVAIAITNAYTLGATLPAWALWAVRAAKAGYLINTLVGAVAEGANFAAATIAPFMFNLMFQWLSVVALFLSGGMFKRFINRWKLIIAIFILEFIAESFLGLNWFPGATVFAILLYRIVLKDRKKSAAQTEEAPESAPEYAYADNYPAEERKAA